MHLESKGITDLQWKPENSRVLGKVLQSWTVQVWRVYVPIQ